MYVHLDKHPEIAKMKNVASGSPTQWGAFVSECTKEVYERDAGVLCNVAAMRFVRPFSISCSSVRICLDSAGPESGIQWQIYTKVCGATATLLFSFGSVLCHATAGAYIICNFLRPKLILNLVYFDGIPPC